MERPLVSFVIGTYNQERFIREAVEGAFAQTYSPLEIIVSDDCSADGTFKIIQEMVAAYTGPHTVRTNRNERNLGLGAHFSRLMQLAKGELIVLAAGDDISLPERTEIVMQAWADSGRKAMSLSSNSYVVDANGNFLHIEDVLSNQSPSPTAVINAPETLSRPASAPTKKEWVHKQGSLASFLRRRSPHASGSAHAISRALVTLFDPLPESVTYEDTALSFRTLLAGGLFTFIHTPLIKYRRHGQNVTFDLNRVHTRDPMAFQVVQEKRGIELDRMIAVYKNFSTDAMRAKRQGLVQPIDYPGLEKRIRQECRRLELRKQLLVRGWLSRCAILFRLYCSTIRPREFLTQTPHLMPRSMYAGLVRARNGAQSRTRRVAG